MAYTEEVRRAIDIAQSLAREYRHEAYGAPHLLQAVLHNEIGLATWLVTLDKDIHFMREWAGVRLEVYPRSVRTPAVIPADKVADTSLQVADIVALQLNNDWTDAVCLLAALIQPGLAFTAEQLKTFPLTQQELIGARGGDVAPAPKAGNMKAPEGNSGSPALEKYCVDKTGLAASGRLDPVTGRDRELRMLLEVLARRSKPNAIIVGEPGVGKTALVDGLARLITEGRAPDRLKAARLFGLDMGTLVAGAAYKGEIEDRVKGILRELGRFEKAILFVDEVHLLLDSRSAAGAGIADLLKPELARGELTMIGATTREEYRKYIEADAAFSRRFEMVEVEEPDIPVAVEMIRQVAGLYEQHHGLRVGEGTLEMAVNLARRYTGERKLPDSAIDLLDRTMAAIKMTDSARECVTSEDIAAIISFKTGIPLGRIQGSEREKLLSAQEVLTRRVVGQDHAVRAVSEAILESRSGLTRAGQPIASFFLLGPTGTGKTELAKSLADFLFNDESFLIRFDMSEFKEEHSAALLYGAPPGYVGYEEGGLLVNRIRQKPYSVVLFDEIEKAHPSVFDIFLQILDEGKLHDRLGKQGDFSNAIILFTSNIGSEYIARAAGEGRTPGPEELMEIMTGHFRPEFLGRLTEIVPFSPVSMENALRIFDIHLRSLTDPLSAQGIGIDITDPARRHLLDIGFSPKYGARPIKGMIRNQLRRPIARMIIGGQVGAGQVIRLSLNEEKRQLEWSVLFDTK